MNHTAGEMILNQINTAQRIKKDEIVFVAEYQLTRFMNGTRPFTILDIKHVMKHLLKSVAVLHDLGLVHRDIKPDNILISVVSKEMINYLRFSSLGMEAQEPHHHDPLWYKAPELLHPPRVYSSAVDMWSAGCIMAELVLNRVLFRGKDNFYQLPCIHEVICPSYNHILLKIASEVAFSGATRLNPNGLDLLKRLLQYDPNDRITARDALNHPFFTQV